MEAEAEAEDADAIIIEDMDADAIMPDMDMDMELEYAAHDDDAAAGAEYIDCDEAQPLWLVIGQPAPIAGVAVAAPAAADVVVGAMPDP
ncbi:hypothetical protein LTR04_004554 [Oleoguttula sp. CCFEE 6159]|nr:hypothetical protein LTR04_004554 [Oleoguttula sp. CCFEE 6159]